MRIFLARIVELKTNITFLFEFNDESVFGRDDFALISWDWDFVFVIGIFVRCFCLVFAWAKKHTDYSFALEENNSNRLRVKLINIVQRLIKLFEIIFTNPDADVRVPFLPRELPKSLAFIKKCHQLPHSDNFWPVIFSTNIFPVHSLFIYNILFFFSFWIANFKNFALCSLFQYFLSRKSEIECCLDFNFHQNPSDSTTVIWFWHKSE